MYPLAPTTSPGTAERGEGSIVPTGIAVGITAMGTVVTGDMSDTKAAVVGAIATDKPIGGCALTRWEC
jgi:hypothetical protein